MQCLVMRTKDGFYPIEALDSINLEDQAKDHGELNDHVIRVETFEGFVLWERK